MRSLFGMLGVRSVKIRVVCDRCLGILGCDRLKLGWLCAIAYNSSRINVNYLSYKVTTKSVFLKVDNRRLYD